LDLTSDELLATTPALRKRLDLDRQVSRSVIEGWRMERLKSRATCEKIVGG